MWGKEDKKRVHDMITKYREIMIQNELPVYRINRIVYGRSISTLGTCRKNNYFKVCTITISDLTLYSEDSLKNTILHELCHALPDTVGHNKQWFLYVSKVNKLFNANIQQYASKEEARYARTVIKQKAKYKVVCNNCGEHWEYMRKAKIVKAIEDNKGYKYICPQCQAYNFSVKYF